MTNPVANKNSRSFWLQIRHRLEYLLYMVFKLILLLFPRKTLAPLSRFLGRLAPILVPSEAKKGRINLEIAFSNSLTQKETEDILVQSFSNMILTSFYYFWSSRLDRKTIEEVMEVPKSFQNLLDEIIKNGKGGIFLLSHYGNWEMLGLRVGYLETPTFNAIVRTLKNPLLNDEINAYRTLTGNRVIHPEQALVKCYRALKRGEFVVIVFDQNFDPQDGGTFAPYFGLQTATTQAAGWLSVKTGAPVVSVFSELLPDGKYRMQHLPPLDCQSTGDSEKDIQRVTELANQSLENYVRENPGAWLWMYKRWRIRPTLEQGNYPDYSRPQKSLRGKKSEDK